MEAASEFGVSPYHLASRIRQEQGASGTSGLISGNYTDYVGYYNYFNIRASGSGAATIIRNGLEHAKTKGWTTPELAIKGGAKFLASGYIDNYQDTLYLEKYQVDSVGGLYSHQYMQNISAPYSEGNSIYKAYNESGLLNLNHNFIIPVYENMPITLSPKPLNVSVSTKAVTENVKVTTASTYLNIRASASTSSQIIAKADKGTTLLRIETAVATSDDGIYWDKVVYAVNSEIRIGYATREYLTKIDDVITTNEQAKTNTSVNFRNGPGTNDTTILQTLPTGTNLTIIDKMTFVINGYYWYRVKLEDETQGYIASEFLTIGTNPPDTPVNPPQSENYKIEGTFLIIVPGTKLENIAGATNQSNIFGTGAKITLNNDTYTLVIIGDVSGDGNITPSDYVKVKNHITGANILTGEYKSAADVNKDGNITPSDYVKIKNHITNASKISF